MTSANLRVLALLSGAPRGPELWTLRRLASIGLAPDVVQAEHPYGAGSLERVRMLVHRHGIRAVVSRVLAGQLIGRLHERRMLRDLDRLFDYDALHEWWCGTRIAPILVPHLNHDDAHAAIASLRPDIIVRVSGGVIRRPVFGAARLVTLNIHHGMAPGIRGMWSIPWGIVEGRGDWIGATVHAIDDGIDTGRVYWRGSPQLAPGDTATTLFFRAHLQAVDALITLIQAFARGETPAGLPSDGGPSSYRSAAGLAAWTRFLRLRQGRVSPVILGRAVEE